VKITLALCSVLIHVGKTNARMKIEDLLEGRKCPSDKEKDKSRESDKRAVLPGTNPFGASP
jgi:hypothetical protein